MIAHLARGLVILAGRWWSGGWIAQAKGPVDVWVRRGLQTVLLMVAFRLLCTSPWLIGFALLAVAVKALRAATKAVKSGGGATVTPSGEAPVEVEETGLPDVSTDAFLGLLHDVLGVAKGVHLRTLAGSLTVRYGGAWEIADVRRLCEAAGVPVTPTVRAPGGKPTVGVYRADLPPLPDPSPATTPAPVVGVVVAGQRGTTTPTTQATTGPSTTPTTPTTTVHGGLRIVATDDPDNPARTHVTVIDPTRKKARQ